MQSCSVEDPCELAKTTQIYGSEHAIVVLVACLPKPHSNAHADVSSRVRGIKFGLSFYLHP